MASSNFRDKAGQLKDKMAGTQIKTLLQEMDNYFVTLANSDPNKLTQRYESYLDIQDKISSLKYKSEKTVQKEQKLEKKDKGENQGLLDELGKVGDFLTNKLFSDNDKDKVKKVEVKAKDTEIPVSEVAKLKNKLTSLVKICRDNAAAFQGKSGPQRYTSILNRLADSIEAKIEQPASTSQSIYNLQQELKAGKAQQCREKAQALLVDLHEAYIPQVEHDLGQQGKRFFDKNINVELSKEKLEIAKYLRDELNKYVQGGETENNIRRLANDIVDVDSRHQKLLTGTIGKEKRLGELIADAKNLLTQYYPAYYAQAKNRGNEQRLEL